MKFVEGNALGAPCPTGPTDGGLAISDCEPGDGECSAIDCTVPAVPACTAACEPAAERFKAMKFIEGNEHGAPCPLQASDLGIADCRPGDGACPCEPALDASDLTVATMSSGSMNCAEHLYGIDSYPYEKSVYKWTVRVATDEVPEGPVACSEYGHPGVETDALRAALANKMFSWCGSWDLCDTYVGRPNNEYVGWTWQHKFIRPETEHGCWERLTGSCGDDQESFEARAAKFCPKAPTAAGGAVAL